MVKPHRRKFSLHGHGSIVYFSHRDIYEFHCRISQGLGETWGTCTYSILDSERGAPNIYMSNTQSLKNFSPSKYPIWKPQHTLIKH